MVADVGLGHADQFGRIGRSRVDGPGRGLGGGVGRLEPHLHVGEPVLERLVRRQRPAEREPVLGVLDGELEDTGRRPRPSRRTGGRPRPGAGARHRLDAARLTEHGVGGHLDLVELRLANRRTRSRLSARRTAVTPGVPEGTRNWAGPRRSGPSPGSGPPRPGLHRSRGALEDEAVTVGDGVGPLRSLPDDPAVPVRAPGGDGLTADQAGQLLVVVGRPRPWTGPRPPRWWGSAVPARPAGPSPRPPVPGRRGRCPEMQPPPWSSDTSIETQPSSAPRRHHSRSKPSGSSSARRRTASSGQVSSRNLAVVSRNSCWSSVRPNCTLQRSRAVRRTGHDRLSRWDRSPPLHRGAAAASRSGGAPSCS